MRKEYDILGLTSTPSREMGVPRRPWPSETTTKILGPPLEELTTTTKTVKNRVSV
ncbi:hypothetical protein KSS87_011623, partial [Heliosperma pusillum]